MLKISSQLLFLLPLALGVGIAMAFQTALLSFTVGTIVLALMVFFQSAEKPSVAELANIPWLLWIGGCLGVYAISMSIYTAPKLGFLTFSGLVIFGQLVISMLLDHFGLLGTDKTPINWQRLLGSIIIFVGVLLTLQR